MTYYKHKRTGKTIEVADSVKMISLWVPVESLEENETADGTATPEIQTFETVVDLKKNADKSLPAKTVRGSTYDYTNGEWIKRNEE
jgi:hypothetical protein